MVKQEDTETTESRAIDKTNTTTNEEVTDSIEIKESSITYLELKEVKEEKPFSITLKREERNLHNRDYFDQYKETDLENEQSQSIDSSVNPFAALRSAPQQR